MAKKPPNKPPIPNPDNLPVPSSGNLPNVSKTIIPEVVDETGIVKSVPKKFAEDVIEVSGKEFADDAVKIGGKTLPKSGVLKYLGKYGKPLAMLAGGGLAAYGAYKALSDDEENKNTQPVPASSDFEQKDFEKKEDTPELPSETPSVDDELEKAKMAYLNKINSFKMPKMKSIDFDAGISPEIMQEYEKVKEIRDRGRLQANVDFLSRAIVGTKQPEEVRKMFEQPGIDAEADFKAKLALQEKDPNSQLSKGFRELAKSMGINLKGDFTAEMGKQILPEIYKLQAADMERQFRAADREMQIADRQLRYAELKAEKAEKDKLKNEDKKQQFTQSLRKEAMGGALGQQLKYVKTLEGVAGTLSEFANNPSAFRDNAMLMQGLKAFQGDNSVVREAEIRLGQNATSAINKAKNAINQFLNGENLQPSQRKEIVEAVKIITETNKRIYNEAIEPIKEQAKDLNIDLKKVFPAWINDMESSTNTTSSGNTSDVKKLIESRSEEENKKRLEELRNKYKGYKK